MIFQLKSRERLAIQLALLLVAVTCLLSAGLLHGLEDGERAWLLFTGFVLLVPVVFLLPRRSFATLFVVAIFVVYGGLSALVAVPESTKQVAEHAKALTKEQIEGSRKAPEFAHTAITEPEAFAEAALLTALAGLAAIGGTYLSVWYFDKRWRTTIQKPAPNMQVSASRMEMAGRLLVAAAFLGVAAALARFVATQIPTNNLHMAIKSFWEGGSYFLLVATFAIPGFGLWLQGKLMRSASRRELIGLGGWAVLYLALLVPTGQRGFAIALAFIAVSIFFVNGRLRLRYAITIAALVAVGIGISQAARNEIREEGGLGLAGLASRLQPNQLRSLYGSQLASFAWTVQVVEYREKLHIPNPYPQLLLKPVPRQLDPNKSQGFGSEFTKRVYPGVAKQGIAFAVPLTAESDYAFGITGMTLIFLLMGVGAGAAESMIADRIATPAKPIVLATVAWCLFVLVRGDLANALVFSAGWWVPLVLLSHSIGLRREPPVASVVIDALQVAPQFSGVGRQVEDIGISLSYDSLRHPLKVRCAGDVKDSLATAFPKGTIFHTPLKSSRPRLLRIAYQQLWAPIWDRRSTVLVALGDQAPVWGRARLVFVINDVRRIARPDTASRGRFEAAFYKVILRRGARRARQIVTISNFSRDEITRSLKAHAPIAVASCHPLNAERQGCRFRTRNEALRQFVVVGALRNYKGHDTVLTALALLDRRSENVEVVCVGGDEAGEGRNLELMKRARELGVDGRFQLRGWVSDSELAEFFTSCLATVNPSYYEGYGLPVAESLARGLPTIASDIPPHREIAQDAALYFSPGDAAALMRIMERVANDAQLRESLARKARARWVEVSHTGPSLGSAIRAAIDAESGTSLAVADIEPKPALSY